MPSRGFFPYDSAYDHNRAEPAEAVQMLMAAANRKPPRPRPLGIPIHIEGLHAEPVDVTMEAAPSAEEAAAVRVQAAARGFLARRSVRAVRRVEREAGAVGRIVAEKAAALRGNGRARLAAAEVLMKMLLRLDAVRGAREYRRRVTRLVLALQDAVDALDPAAAPPPGLEAVAQGTGEAAEESAVALELPPDAAESSGEMESNAGAAAARTKAEMDGSTAAACEPEAEADEEMEEPSPGDTNVDDVRELQDSDGDDGEWEMVAEEPVAAASVEAPRQEPSEQTEITRAAEAAGAFVGVDTAAKLVEMVAALCEQSAQQCAVIGALVERVDALERAVRQMVEEAER